jgi:hypothetical protein
MDALQNKRTWLGGGIVLAVVIVAASWLMLISPRLSDASSLRGNASSAETQNFVLQSKLARLKKQNENIAELRASLRSSLDQLPVDSGLPDFTRQLSAQAAANHVSVSSVSIGSIAPAQGSSGASAAAGAVYSVQVTLISDGTYLHQLSFLKAIQVEGPRRALVGTTQFAAGSGGSSGSLDPSSTMTTQLTIFSSPVTPAVQAQLEKELSGDTSS